MTLSQARKYYLGDIPFWLDSGKFPEVIDLVMKTIPTLCAALTLTASGAFAQTPSEMAQMQVNMYSPTGRMMQERNAIIAAPLTGSSSTADLTAALEAQKKIIKLLEEQNTTLSSQYLLLQKDRR